MAFKSKYTGKQIENLLDSSTTKQDKLVSGTNIKTINGQSLLGSGDITVQGGESSNNDYDIYPQINHGTSDTTFTLTPNTFHVWDEVTSLNLTLGEETPDITNEFLFQFTSGSEPTTLTLPSYVGWEYENPLYIDSDVCYQISILRNKATFLTFHKNTFKIKYYLMKNFIFEGPFIDEFSFSDNQTWFDWVNSTYNNGNYYILDDIVYRNFNGVAYSLFYPETDEDVYATDKIINNKTYSNGDIEA